MGQLPQRDFGATGVQTPLLGFGTAPLGKTDRVPHDRAVEALETAIDAGITYLDTSPDYGSEAVVGEVASRRRDEVFLATKINNRSFDRVYQELKDSLERLQVESLDLIQVHAVNAYADLEQALAPDGAVAALEKARKDGLVRFIGITGHARPDLLRWAIERYPFDSVLCALGIGDRLVTGPDVTLLPAALEQNIAVVAMKVMGHGHYQDRELALRYSLGLPGVSVAIVGMESAHQVLENAAIAANFTPLSEQEEARLIEQVKPLIQQDCRENNEGKGSLFWLHDTNVMGWAQHDEPVLVSY